MWLKNLGLSIESLNNVINSVVWGVPMLIMIISTGIYLTVRTGFFQIIRAKFILNETFIAIFKKRSVTKTKDKKAISQFQALSTALAATIGTGNIAGVATAIAAGGPGAIFWMWVSAFFGMMTNYCEKVLGIYFRKKDTDGQWCGGPMYYLENGLTDKKGKKLKIGKILAVIFSVFCIGASFGIGNMTQVNSIATAMDSCFGISPVITGIVLAIAAALVILGGIKRIGSVTEKLVPFMALFYIIGTIVIFFMNIKQAPYIFSSIFKNAFDFRPIAGAASGLVIKRAVTIGFKRGVFSNEAGLGSSVIVHSSSDVKEPAVQGMWGIFEVFFDTIIMCTLTAFVLLSSTCDAVSLEHAVQNVTTEPQYVSIYDIDSYKSGDVIPLLDTSANPPIELAENSVSDSEIEKHLTVCPASGEPFGIRIMKSNPDDDSKYIYTNIMQLTGIAKKDADGNPVLDSEGNEIIDAVVISQVDGAPLAAYAFSRRFGNAAGMLLAIAILLFAFSTVIGWSFYGTKAMEYLFGAKSATYYKAVFVLFIIIGATIDLRLAWDISDTLNGLMAIPNLIGVLALSGTVIKITRNYTMRKITKTHPDAEPMLSAYEDIQEAYAAEIKAEIN